MSLVVLVEKLKGGKGSGDHGHSGRPGKRGGSSGGSGRVWAGDSVASGDAQLSKLQVGAIGEQLAMRALSEKMGTEFKTLNVGLNNAPIDVMGDHTAVEVKTGLASNGKTAQHWRATIGQPGKAETSLIDQMTAEEKKLHHAFKQEKILERKQAMLTEISKRTGAKVQGATVGVILASDGKRGDVYMIPGFHSRLPWKNYATDEYYVGSYDV